MTPATAEALRPAHVANALVTGAFLGTLQWSVFFLLQSYLTSTAVVYLLATSVWLIGSLVGMVVPGRREALWLLGSVGCFYLFRSIAVGHPYALGWLPPLLLLIAGMGAYAGRFFRCRAGVFPSVKWLFFLENTGFVAGMATTAVALYWTGATYFAVAPLVAAALAAVTGWEILFPPARREGRLRRLLPASRGEQALILTGAGLMLLDFILVEHATAAFDHAEIAVMMFSLSYFSGVSLGYLVSDRLSGAAIRRFLPVCLLVQMGLFVGLQPLHDQIAHAVSGWADRHALPGWIGEGSAVAGFFLVVAGFATSLFAVFLPRVIEDEGKDLRRCYALEIAGSLLGLSLVPLLMAISHRALLGGYLVTVLVLARAVGVRWGRVAAMAAAAAAFLVCFDDWDRAAAGFCYARRHGWEGSRVVLTRYTPYHKIEVVSTRSSGRYRLLLDGKPQFGGDPAGTYAYFVAEYPARILVRPRVCLLGCGSMATVGRIGGIVPSVKIVDLDAEVFAAARRYFQPYNHLDELHNWTFTADDAKHWLANADDTFDLVLHDIPPARSRQVALTYTDEAFRLVKARLTPRGIFSISSLTPVSEGSHYARRMLRTLTRVFDRSFALVHGGSTYFYGGGPDLRVPDRAALLASVDSDFREGTEVLLQAEIEALVLGESVITISNVGDLIYD